MRDRWMWFLLGLFAMLCPAACSGVPRAGPMPATHLFVATTDGRVRALALDEDGAPATVVAEARLGEPLQFLAFQPRVGVLYALGEARLHALRWRSEPPALSVLGAAETGVRGTHLAVDASGRHAVVASYADSALAVLQLEADGRPGAVVDRTGGAEDPTFARAHQVRIRADGRTVLVPCLGADHVATLALDPQRGTLHLLGTALTDDEAGPRHLDEHPHAPFVYVLNERASSVTVFRVDAASGALTPVDAVSTLPEGAAEASRSSDIKVSVDGRWVFAVNREPLDDIVRFAVAADGRLSPVDRVPTGGRHARTIALDPTGTRLWVGNTRSQDLSSFAILADGRLEPLPGRWDAGAEIYCVLAR
jgi:6-phosphogluconolactonase (cycloisomerase 2 family)